MKDDKIHLPSAPLWNSFVQSEGIGKGQKETFEQFFRLVKIGNKFANLTRITSIDKFIALHLKDSLAIRRFVNISERSGIVDVGSGAGFPGIPLAIVYPEVPVYLLEVHSKRLHFLKNTIRDLNLSNCEVIDLDWRTFVRTTAYPIDLMVARASLTPRELVRAFKPTSAYNNGTIVYWASGRWECPPSIEPFLKKEVKYRIKCGIHKRTRKLIFLEKPA